MIKHIKRLVREYKNRNLYNSQHAASAIGQFYLEKNKGSYKKAIEEILQIGITKVLFSGNKLSITLTRPGLLIGYHGENIDRLKVFLTCHLDKLITIHIIEDTIISSLYPYEPYTDDDIDSAMEGI